MHDFTHPELQTLIAHSFANAFDRHGDLGLEPETFSTHLSLTVKKHVGVCAPPVSAIEFVKGLHLSDIYLSLACSHGSSAAWGRFVSLYEDSILKVCKCICPSNDAAREMADSMPGQLFLPGSTGSPRIASYVGLCPLVAWLGVVVRRLAEKKRLLKYNNLESIDRLPDVADQTSLLRIEAALKADRYAAIIMDCLQCAVSLLSDRERVILHLRYERKLQVREVAQLFGVKPPSITRQIDRTGQKLREEFTSMLTIRHRLAPEVIEECLAHILENPEYAAPVLT